LRGTTDDLISEEKWLADLPLAIFFCFSAHPNVYRDLALLNAKNGQLPFWGASFLCILIDTDV